MTWNWAAIGSGDDFESLVHTLVSHVDHRARAFSRPGPDSGQDARSGDGTRVYQAKYVSDRSASAAIRAAKEEATKIAKYKKPEHRNHDKWSAVTSWVLVTNARFNANDVERWEKVANIFQQIGIEATYWCSAKIESLLADYPQIARVYFEGETRLFLGAAEHRRSLATEEVLGASGALAASFVGRRHELDRIQEFLESPASVLLVHQSSYRSLRRSVEPPA